ncbi:glycosyltransferase family 4 protein [Candidatus Symbiopectobacterium sp. NZEC135]|uniref:glycosyltransferase family 4 protein n=1 Tax=Candidatus Symbiopectobacterium sp. NZEC135 TaxID=2820471 RepID=UPI002227201F|nr:glycosyltransferase family 4 protein [Candidatus Symbiopectobacterium sp. NZEC135]MCW2481847.1 glycosyltransferase family 4 protein [Candidatus Symbiopectobacterium sp. NZEC135]
MNIGLYCNWGVVLKKDGFYISAIHAKYILAFLDKSEKITLLSKVKKNGVEDGDVFLSYNRITVISLPSFHNYVGAIKYFKEIKNGIKELQAVSSFIYVRTPEPFSWLLMNHKTTSVNYHFTSNPIQVIKNKKISKFKKVILLMLFYPEYLLTCFSAYFSLCSSNGDSVKSNVPFFLRNKLKILIESSITSKEMRTALSSKKVINNSGDKLINYICVCRFVPAKGIEVLVDAIFRLVNEKKIHNISLTFVGDGPIYQDVKNLVEQYELQKYIIFKGFVENGPELFEIYKKSDVFINPSLSETGPRVILEGMAYSLYCITTDVGYCKRVLSDGNKIYGYVINRDSSNELMDAMLYVHNNFDSCLLDGLHCQKIVQEYTLDNFINEVIR